MAVQADHPPEEQLARVLGHLYSIWGMKLATVSMARQAKHTPEQQLARVPGIKSIAHFYTLFRAVLYLGHEAGHARPGLTLLIMLLLSM